MSFLRRIFKNDDPEPEPPREHPRRQHTQQAQPGRVQPSRKQTPTPEPSHQQRAQINPDITVSVSMSSSDPDRGATGPAIIKAEERFHYQGKQGSRDDVIRIDDPSVRDELMTLTSVYIHPSPLIALLLGQQVEWLEFDRWHDYFTNRSDWPRSWFKVINRPSESEYSSYYTVFSDFRALSPPSRQILSTLYAIGKPRLTSEEEILNRVGLSYEMITQSIEELTAKGILRGTTRDEALGRHTVETMKGELEMLGLKKSGRKAQLIDRLLAESPEDVLSRLVPESFLNSSRTIEYPVASSRDTAEAFERQRIAILDSYCSELQTRSMWIDNSESWAAYGGLRTATVRANLDSCHLCREHHGRQVTLSRENIEQIPPYHPGSCCRIEFDHRHLT